MLERLAVPVIAAPMAGGASTPKLVAEVGSAGGLGFLAAGLLTVEALAARLTEVSGLTDRPFGVNLFVPGSKSTVDLSVYRERVAAQAALAGVTPGTPVWDDDSYPAKLELLLAMRVPIVSFTFGLPGTDEVRRLHAAGTYVVVTVTTAAEAKQAAQIGADALCVQGLDAGGHRGTLTDDGVSPGGGELLGTLAALRLVAAAVDLPLIAAGGLVTGADVAAVVTAGAVAAQLGTAFLLCPEAGTAPGYRMALQEKNRRTALTRAFSGRPARGLVNRFLTENTAHAPAAYPNLHLMTKPIRAAGDPELMSLWAGQTYSLIESAPAADVVRRLDTQARAAIRGAAARFAEE